MSTQFDLFSPAKAASAPGRTFRVHFDGGAKGRGCEPGTGYGYGSYQIDGREVVRVDHHAVMTANAAEVLTLCEAMEECVRLHRPEETKLDVFGDSQIALACTKRIANAKAKVKLKGSDIFQDAQLRLADLVRRFATVETHWLPREHAVAAFGH